MNQKSSTKTKQLLVKVEPCNPALDHEGYECAEPDDISKYFADKYLMYYEVKNFIDYNSVGGEIIKRMALETFLTPIATSAQQKLYIEASYIETQVTLKDDLWQFFVSPNEFSFLNLSPRINYTLLPRLDNMDIFLGMVITLDTEI